MEKTNRISALKPKINDFCLTIATVNGSGSATANNTLYRSFFRMGIPCAGKNIFPSNIKGLPTWYSIRVSKDGYLARVSHDDILIAMNKDTIKEDINFLVPGGVIFHDSDIILQDTPENIICYPMPINELIKMAEVPRNLKDYMENMLYVGIVGQVLGIDLEIIEQVIGKIFSEKKDIAKSNFNVIKTGFEWAKSNIVKTDNYFIKQMPLLNNHILIDGNSAGALGSLYGGVQFCGWYPITPASSMVETMIEYAPQLRSEPETSKQTYAIVQAEDELAAIGMAIGAGWAGLRAMTSTSGPGISLMTEYLGLAYFTEVPVVVWDVQRVGPSTGLPTRTAQGDLTMLYFIGHGDTNHIILIPGSVNECFEFGWKSFNIAEKYQTPVFVLTDLDLGMNQWCDNSFSYPSEKPNRGKILWERDLEKWERINKEEWGRYKDIDGDGITYRTVLGNISAKAAYFTRGTGHDEFGAYSEEADIWKQTLNRLKKKFENVHNDIPEPLLRKKDGKIGLIGMGSTDPAIQEAQDILEKNGIKADYLRIRSLPSGPIVNEFISEHEKVYILELNRDGQLFQVLSLENSEYIDHLTSIAEIDGLPMTAEWVVHHIMEMESK